jgi:hypothetical protein
MTEDANRRAQRLLHHPDVPAGAKRDLRLLESAAISIDAALARLPRTMPWSAQPAIVFAAMTTSHTHD